MKALIQDTAIGHSTEINLKASEGMELIEKRLYEILADSEGTVADMCRHILAAGGKRVRPLMVLYSGLVFSGWTQWLLDAAAAAELIHMASLVHDDIIDNSYMRRSKPSVNKTWGNHFAVLCGDYLFARAFGILSDSMLIRSLNYMVEAIGNMCHGEIIQAEGRFDICRGIDDYYLRIGKKTAIFLKCCCMSGAATAGSDPQGVEAIGDFGLNLGYAFQIVDDVLDFCGDEKVMGKPRVEDLRQGNITLPLMLLMDKPLYSDWVKRIVSEKKFSDEEIEKVVFVLKDSGTISETLSIAGSHINKALQSLGKLPQNKYTALLAEMADKLVRRVN